MRTTEQITLCTHNGHIVNTMAIPVFDPPPAIVFWREQFFVRTSGENGVHYCEAWCYPGLPDGMDTLAYDPPWAGESC